MDKDAKRCKVLLAEDDPVSREFLREAVATCGARVTACADGPAALALARSGRWDLLILDQHLPGLDGDAVLAALRAAPNAASRTCPALATSAARDTELAALLSAGFSEVLPKPIRIETLQAALRRHGCRPPDPSLDDEDALHACGSPEVAASLRRLFAEQELPAVQAALDRAGDNPATLRPILHRLQASCGFCGARALAQASAVLDRALADGAPEGAVWDALAAFRTTLAETRAALQTMPPAPDQKRPRNS